MAYASLARSVSFLNVSFGDDDLVDDLGISEQPYLKIIGQPEVKGGSTVEEKFYLGGPRNGSGDLNSALQMAEANGGGSKTLRWQHPFGEHVGVVEVAVSDVIQSKPDQAAADKALEAEMKKGMDNEGQQLVNLMLGRAGLAGGVGVWTEASSGGFPTFCIRFTDPSDARRYMLGEQVVIALADGDTDGDLVGLEGFVMSRDVSLGYIRLAALDDIDTAGNPGDWIDGVTYFVFRLGEYADGSPENIITSLERFLPSAATTTTLHNVDRSFDSSLSGARLPTGQSRGGIMQRTKRLAAFGHGRLGWKKGGDKNSRYIHLLHSEEWNTVGEELETKGKRDIESTTTSEGYEAFTARTAVGSVDFVADPGKNKGTGFFLNTSLLKVYSASGKWFEPIPVDGNSGYVRLKEGSNVYQIRTLSKIATGIGATYMHGVVNTTLA
jgi:hypothetical protein